MQWSSEIDLSQSNFLCSNGELLVENLCQGEVMLGRQLPQKSPRPLEADSYAWVTCKIAVFFKHVLPYISLNISWFSLESRDTW